jgi:sugar phosphate isomerase/epimerase
VPDTLPLGVTAVMLPDMDFDEQIALCQELGITHYSLRPRMIPENMRDQPWSNWGNHKFDLTPQRLLREAPEIRRKLLDAGLTPFGTLPRAEVDDGDLAMHFEAAAKVGAGRVRVGPGAYPKGHFDYPQWLEQTVGRFAKAVALAKPLGVKIVIETHARSFAASPALAWNICRHFSPDEVGTIFDIANFNIEGNLQPNLAVAVLDRYIDHCHVGGSQLYTSGYDQFNCRKPAYQMCPMTESNLHIPSWIAALHQSGLTAPLIIESFTANVSGELRLREAVGVLRRVLGSLDRQG